MAGGVKFEAADLAADPHKRERLLHRVLKRGGNLGNAEFGQIRWFGHRPQMIQDWRLNPGVSWGTVPAKGVPP